MTDLIQQQHQKLYLHDHKGIQLIGSTRPKFDVRSTQQTLLT